jgi:hypothetical protein
MAFLTLENASFLALKHMWVLPLHMSFYMTLRAKASKPLQ